jgi:hypothetical protein
LGKTCIPANLPTYLPQFSELEVPDPDIGAVVVGGDYSVNYGQICMAALCLQKIDGCPLLVGKVAGVGWQV